MAVHLAHASGQAFAVCLSGGSTPRRLCERLADPAVASRFPWMRAHWFWGDERFVPARPPWMARGAFLSRVPIPDDKIHAVPTEGLSPEQAAATYERILSALNMAEDALPPGQASLQPSGAGG
jgi:6-phosphogluconolactonase